MNSGAGAGRWPSTAWAAFVAGRPALVLPHPNDPGALPADGWHPQSPAGHWDRPDTTWAAVLAADALRITLHGRPWFEHGRGPSWPGQEWQRAARTRGSILLVTGPFDGHHDFPTATATAAHALLLLVVPLTGAAGP
ncbi:hypothetical protein ACFC1R_36080 [Kitasatospora sp. NPDC056138]|uniref:hypothetical protein n=1 Tax=Kitasatospora sp. NPDC056138 TaxID=3345724 RepID=UPI0035D68532